jgi:hypothetical protein
VADAVGVVVLGEARAVLFGLDVDELAALAVFEAEFAEVAGAAAGGAAGFEADLGGVGEAVGVALFAVVDAAGDDGAVGVALRNSTMTSWPMRG